MASKSKRRRRVLGASCILAALIIAASSFAWFTSKDEVTNRLTANADYGVSIVESFSPPANWLPGEEVNKDVYDVNTGNIAAFVKNDVSGVLSYTYEMKTNTRDANCIKLNKLQVQTIDGVTTNEGGGFLAWTDAANVDVGAINSARTADSITDTWEPTVAGTYIFRRKINTSATGGSTFTYAGYYFDGTDYYKIVIGEDNYRAESGQQFDLATPQDKLRDGSGNALAADAIDPVNGTITANTLKIYYVKDVEITNQNVVFTLDKDAQNKPYLKVEYTAAPATVTDATNNVVYDASADAARKEIDYYNKLGESNRATVRYEQAKADYDYATALATQSNTLRDAAVTRNNASTTTSQKETDLSDKWTALTTKAAALVNDYIGYKNANFYEVGATQSPGVAGILFSASQIARIEDTTSVPVLTSSQNNLTTLRNLYNEIKSLDSDLNIEISKISGTTYLTPAELDVIVTTINGKLDTLANKLEAYSNAYSLITDDPNTATQLGLSATDADGKKTALNTLKTEISGLKNGMATEVAAYKNAYTARDGAVADEAAAQTAWLAAIDTYNTEVSDAKTAYDSVVKKQDPAIQKPTAESYSNNGTTIVQDNTLTSTTTAPDPTIDKTTYANGYDTIAGLTAVTMPTAPSSPSISDLEQAMNDAIQATNDAERAYNDAKIAVESNSKITINVYLDEDYANNWQMDADTDKTDKVSFYLKSILDAGATTDKLIDKVVLADTVTANDYKNMTFDLNVALDSAQVVYDNDQNTVLPTAVNSNGAFGMKATVANDNKTVTWAANTP